MKAADFLWQMPRNPIDNPRDLRKARKLVARQSLLSSPAK
jgi:hypothetical protein